MADLADRDIRPVLAKDITGRYPGALVRHEMGLCAHTRRADVAVITRSELIVFEIKSDRDTLTRLPGQVEVYSQVADRAVLVTTGRHMPTAARHVPDWWGITLATPTGRCMAMREYRAPGVNPGPDPMALARMLWRDEALTILRTRGNHHGLSHQAKYHAQRRIAETIPPAQLCALVRDQIRARDWANHAEVSV